MDRRRPFIAERVLWAGAVLALLVLVGQGLSLTFQIELTDEAIEDIRTGTRMINVGLVALVCAAALGLLRGAPAASCCAVLLVPLVCGGLLRLYPDSLLPHLAFLGAAPVAGGGALVAVFVRWRAHRRPGADVRPTAAGGRS